MTAIIIIIIITTTYITRTSFERIYWNEQNVKVKERMLLILNVVYSDRLAVQVVSPAIFKVD